VFKAFGAKAKRTPCSAEALRKRVLRDGAMPAIDPVVDLYNAISIRYALPVGGENIAAYAGTPRLVIADGSERFDTVKEGEVVYESPEPGEVIWRDDEGVTCRRWNWRQGVRTRLDASARQMWFILESLPAMPLTALQQASDELISGLQQMMPGAEISATLIEEPAS
jgi:DNA/RNA-binding domain of Phe-tRNA-synthetase-like protein